ncbi:MAG: methyltransferase domain-containing protein [Saprospiraceae bacterium]|nr:methyltransferase domain-containing protein [Saprospiraceae bacterium]
MQEEWFSRWFDSPYYHLLYQHHNDDEASVFIDNLFQFLEPPAGARMLDQACGKGRHALYMSRAGYDVTGLDISPSSITFARQFEHAGLSFFQHDMRKPFRMNYYDIIFNFFTSFGYFKTEEEHVQTLKNIRLGLRPNGIFVLDFLNARKVAKELIGKDNRTLDGITFSIHRTLQDGIIQKQISFSDQGRDFVFEEQVKAYDLVVLTRLFAAAGLEVYQTFGNYHLDDFDEQDSDRLILLGRKTNAREL